MTIKLLNENILAQYSISKCVISSIAGWSTIYFLIKKITKQETEWVIRTVTAVHATVITIFAVLNWSCIKQWNIEQLGQTNTKYEEAILCLTLGYFLFDIYWIVKYQTDGTAMLIHHSASILCLCVILIKGISASEVLVAISGLELTNPCLQARWFLRNYGYCGTWLYTIMEFIFILTFILFRIFYGSYLTYNIILHPNSHIILKFGTISLYIISWTFAFQMFFSLGKRFIRYKRYKGFKRFI